MVALTQISAYSTHKNLSCTHGSDAYSARKKRDSVSTRLKLHTRQTITVSTRVLWKESAHRFQYFAESFDGGKGDFGMRHSFLYTVGTHFRIFVRKFLVHFRTVCASAQKLARPLHGVTFWVNYSNKRCIIGAALSRGRRSLMFLISNAALIWGRRSLMFLFSNAALIRGRRSSMFLISNAALIRGRRLMMVIGLSGVRFGL